jgi:hypothetical protein
MRSINYNAQVIDKDICNALGCKSLAELEIELSVGKKKIIIAVCKDCLYKFTVNDGGKE